MGAVGLNAAPAVAKPKRKNPPPSPSLASPSHHADTPPPEYDSDAGRPSPVGSAGATAAAVATAAATAVVAEAFSIAVVGIAGTNTAPGTEALPSASPAAAATAGTGVAGAAGAPPDVSTAATSGARSAPAAAAAAEAGFAAGSSPTGDGVSSSSEGGSVVTVRHGFSGGGSGGGSDGIEGSASFVSWDDTVAERAATAAASADPPGPASGVVYKKRVFGPGTKVGAARDNGRKEELEEEEEEEEVGGSTSPPSVESASQLALPAITVSTKRVVHGAASPSGGNGGVGERNTDSEAREEAAGDTEDGLSSSGKLRKASRLAFSELKHDVREERLYKANAGARLVFLFTVCLAFSSGVQFGPLQLITDVLKNDSIPCRTCMVYTYFPQITGLYDLLIGQADHDRPDVCIP